MPAGGRPGRSRMWVVALLNLTVGFAFAWLARERVRADGPFAAPAFVLVVMHAALIVAPLCCYLYAAHADWAWMYVIDPASVPGIAWVPLMVIHGGLVIAGWLAGAWLQRSEHRAWLGRAAIGAGVVCAAALILTSDRLLSAATYRGWAVGARFDLFEVETGYAVAVVLLIAIASVAYVAVELTRDGRRARTR